MSARTFAPDAANPPRSSASITSFARSQAQSPSVRTGGSGRAAPPSGIRTVVTAPPWARDEPPSPYDQEPHIARSGEFSETHTRPSDVVSYQSSVPDDPGAGPSRWWAFAKHGSFTPPNPFGTLPPRQEGSAPRAGIQLRERSKSIAWLTSPIHRRSEDESSPILKEKQPQSEALPPIMTRRTPAERPFHLDLPAPDPVVTTLSHNKTPGWDSPWTPRPPADIAARVTGNGSQPAASRLRDSDTEDDEPEKLGSAWARRKKRFRSFMLNNTYVPLLFRFINITFTSAALGMAIKIRNVERVHGAMGAVGSSPTVVIIFAPLTMVHVMAAVYMEYFGRPLGLWRTSAKLAHTLFEVVFICAWSAALALCFDNFFTSVIPCASLSATSWYNELPRPPPIASLSTGDGRGICRRQLALICLVGVGLIMYCYNLIISLFRIFEKVKYHPVHTLA